MDYTDPILASIDLGTNTFRLLIARVGPGDRMEFLHVDRRIVRLGAGLAAGGLLQQDAIRRALDALLEFRRVLSRFSVDDVAAVATSAVREAANRETFLEAVYRETGFAVEIVSAAEEARRTALGVLSGLSERGSTGRFLIMDIGGGSTEFIWGEAGLIVGVKSVDLGVVRLADAFDEGEGLFVEDEIRRQIQTVLAPVFSAIEAAGTARSAQFVGTAGTVTTLAALDQEMPVYDPGRIHRHRINLARIRDLYHRLAGCLPVERLNLPGMERGREDLILHGCLILICTMESLGLNQITVSEYGLREGILIDLYRRRSENPSWNPILSGR